MNRSRTSPLAVLAGSAIAIALLAGLHAVATIRDGVTRHQWTGIASSLSVELKGDIEFTADDLEVARISPGGHLEVLERNGLVKRKLTIVNGSDGLEYRYRRGGDSKPYDDDAREWFAALLPRVIRETGIGAQARVARILADSGTKGVFEEIGRIDGSAATRIYCSELLEQGDLNDAELGRLAEVAADGIASSGELAGRRRGPARVLRRCRHHLVVGGEGPGAAGADRRRFPR